MCTIAHAEDAEPGELGFHLVGVAEDLEKGVWCAVFIAPGAVAPVDASYALQGSRRPVGEVA